MPHRFQLIERIAFSFVVLSAVACSAFIAYERCPDVKTALRYGKEAARLSGEYSATCVSPLSNPCAQLPIE